MRKRLTLLAITALLFVQCAPKSVDGGDIYPLEFTKVKSVEAFAKLVDSMTVTQLQFPEDIAVGQVNKVIKTKNGNIAMAVNHVDRKVLLFDKSGEFISELTSVGYADGELRAVNDIATDFESDELYLLDALNKLFVYDASTGEFLERVKPLWEDGSYRLDAIAMGAKSGEFSVVSSNTSPHLIESPCYAVTTFSEGGDQTGQYLETKEYIIDRALVSQTCDNGYIMRPIDSLNTVYRFEAGVPVPMCNINFEELQAPAYVAYNEAGRLKLADYFANGYYKFVSGLVVGTSNISFVAATPGGGAIHYIFDRESGRGVQFAAADGKTVPEPFVLADNEMQYTVFSKYSTDELEQRGDVMTRYLVGELGVLDAGAGYKLVGLKFKEL